MKKILALVLTVLLISASLLSCTTVKENPAGTNDAQTTDSNNQINIESIEESLAESIEESLAESFNGAIGNSDTAADNVTDTAESDSSAVTDTSIDTNTSIDSDTDVDTDSNTDASTDSNTDASTDSNTDASTETGGETEPRPLTKFEIQFSVENEERLEKMLSKVISATNVSIAVPNLSISPSKTAKAGDNGLVYIYENASFSLYNECCDALYARNFAQYTETEFNGTAYNSTSTVKNYFTTFLSNSVQIDIGFHNSKSLMYLTATPRVASALPAREAPTYAKPSGNYPVIWTQFGLEDIDNAESSLGYIIRLADGSFIIIDGGEWFSDNSKNNAVAKRIYDILKKQAPDPDNVVISAWIITHAHNDHAGAFYNFQVSYDQDPTIKIKQMIHNFPDQSLLNANDYNYQESTIESASKFLHKPETLKPHTGNVLYFPGMKINVLYTQENYLAVSDNFTGNYNCASLVLQFVTDDGTKILVGADHPVSGNYNGVTWCEGALYNWYGTFIQSQVVSLFHHGYGGGADTTIYYVIKPSVVLWPSDLERINQSNVKNFAHNAYFSGSNPEPGVTYYIAAGSSVQVISFSNKKPTITEYSDITQYLNS